MKEKSWIPWAKPDFWGKEREYLLQALDSTWISGGPFIDKFENEFASYCGMRYALTASNGTTALHMAYLALGLSQGDEIIIPGYGFMGAANMALYVGATPVFVDVDAHTWCLTASEVEKCLSPNTKLIVPIHTYGNVCAMNEIISLSKQHNIPVFEDVAEAFASRYDGQLAGTFGLVNTFSFQATKTITTGEGGMVVTNDAELYDKMSLYRSHGMRRKRFYWHDLAGHNFRLTNLQAAIGVAQLERLDKIILERKRVHNQYRQLLMDLKGVTLQNFPSEVDSVLWAVAIKLDPTAFPQGRDQVIEEIRQSNIETRPGFVAPRFMPHIYNCPSLSISEELSQQVISLPTYPSLSDEQINYIVESLRALRN